MAVIVMIMILLPSDWGMQCPLVQPVYDRSALHAKFCNSQMSDVLIATYRKYCDSFLYFPILPTVQFDGAEWDRSSSPTERLRPPGPRSSPLAGGGMKFRMPQDSLSMVGERVDPTLPLEKQVYVCNLLLNS